MAFSANPRSVFVSATLPLFLVACGGKVDWVVASGSGSGGHGGAGGAGGSMTSSSSVASVPACETICAARVEGGCIPTDVDSCVHACSAEVAYAAGCSEERDVVLACMVEKTIPGCGSSGECKAEQVALSDCLHPPGDCTTKECTFVGTNHCELQCGDTLYASECTTNGDGTHDCTCFVNGTQIGACLDEVSASGPCCQLFYKPPT